MTMHFGWIDNPAEVARGLATLPHPHFATAAAPIRDSGKGKTVLLFEPLQKLLGHFPIHNQAIGDCVSHGYSLAVDILKAVEIVLLAENETFLAETASEWIYHTSRIDIGGGQLGNEDGSLGLWAGKAIAQQGILARQKYGSVDLSTYSGTTAKQWGSARTLPAELYGAAKEHPVKTVSQVLSYEEARDAIANGYPVPVCSQQGFDGMKRDAEGFAAPHGSWGHCMCFTAVDDSGNRPGLLCQNSWGPDWITGPKRLGQPDGSFWVDAAVATKMLKAGDSFAISSFQGYPARTLPKNWDF